ncbi:MAG: hypothetical protein ACLFV0_05535 [Nitriliruptoraceae bacterium]
MRTTSPARRERLADESGIAMVSIIGLTAVLTLVAVVAVNFALSAQGFSRDHQDWNAALAAAEAGLDDYLARLNRDRGYFNTAAADIDPATGLNLNPAIDRWAALPGSDAYYHYRVDTSEVLESGTLTLTSAGRVGDETRVVQARVRPESFFDFIYFTDFEVVDPAILGPDDTSLCARRFEDVPGRSSQCVDLRFVSEDVLEGPVHSNDAMQIEGTPTFLGSTTTSFNEPDGGYVNFTNRRTVEPFLGDPRFTRDLDPAWSEEKVFPPTNSSIITDAVNHGCMYYGPTYIHLQGTTMTVKSPLSENAPSGAPPTPTECAGPGAGGPVSNLDDFTSGIDIPPVIYVDEAGSCGTFSNRNHPLGVDRGEETRPDLRYGCRFGDVFVWGELDTQLTIAAQNNINVIWDLTYQDGIWQDGTNILGLVADNFVQVRQPRWNNNSGDRPVAGRPPFPSNQPAGVPSGALFRDPEIHAAILSLERSFRVQNHDEISPLGDLIVRGSIAQRFRGPVGTGSATSSTTGFLKDYRYDERLRFISPPYFIDPVEAQYVTRNWAEVTTATGFPDGLPEFPNPDPDASP